MSIRTLVLAAVLALPACGGIVQTPTEATCPANRVCGSDWSIVPPTGALPVASRTTVPDEVVTMQGMVVTSTPFEGTLADYVTQVLGSYGYHVVTIEPHTVAGQPGVIARLPGSIRRYATVTDGIAISVDYDTTTYEYRDTWEQSIATLTIGGAL